MCIRDSYYFPAHKSGEVPLVFTHPIGIGKVGWKTPEGVTKITRRQKDPIWHVPVSVIKEHKENGENLDRVIGPGPDNPLGRYAFYLAWPSYLIHGTNKPAGVGLRSSHGCIRLYPEDIQSFYDMIPVGTQVRVVNQPFLFGWLDGEFYMQASGPLEDDSHDGKQAQADGLPKACLLYTSQPIPASRRSHSKPGQHRQGFRGPGAEGADRCYRGARQGDSRCCGGAACRPCRSSGAARQIGAESWRCLLYTSRCV